MLFKLKVVVGKNGLLKEDHVDANVLFLHIQYIFRGGKQDHPF